MSALEPAGGQFLFSPFLLDLTAERLLHGKAAVSLRPKSFAVLSLLVRHAGKLVTRDDLMDEVWAEAVVTDDTLTQSVAEIRRLLGDDPRRPRFVQTVHGRGFRFIAPVSAVTMTGDAAGGADTDLVGRESDLAALQQALDIATYGERQIVLVSGEPGVGKSALLQAFVRGNQMYARGLMVGWGCCVKQYGHREPYLPLLDALDLMLQAPSAERLRLVLSALAPTWAQRLPQTFERQLEHDVTSGRSLRELARALEALADEQLVVLVIEDLQWADPSTLDFLAMLARRPGEARLLVLASVRSTDTDEQHSATAELVSDLRDRRAVRTLDLAPLDPQALGELVRRRCGKAVHPSFARWLHRRTGGSPLLVAAMMRGLLERPDFDPTRPLEESDAWLTDIPHDLHASLEANLSAIHDDHRRALQAAAVAGAAFDAQEIAAALESDVEQAEASCRLLERPFGLLQASSISEWPDGSIGARYAFRHDLYRQHVHDTIPPATLRGLHDRIGRRLQTGFGAAAPASVLARLGFHFEHSGDRPGALSCLAGAAMRAISSGAFREAHDYIRAAQAHLDHLPDERMRQERELFLLRTSALAHARTYTAAALREILLRIIALAGIVGDSAADFEARYALWFYHSNFNDDDAAQLAVRELRARAATMADRENILSDYAAGSLAFWNGRAAESRACMSTILSSINSPAADGLIGGASYGLSPFVGAASYLAYLSGVDMDRERMHELRLMAREIALRSERAFTLAGRLAHECLILWISGDPGWLDATERAHAECERYAFPTWSTTTLALHGAATVERGAHDEGLSMIAEARRQAAEANHNLTSYMRLIEADCCLRLGRLERGLAATVAPATTRARADRWLDGEITRLRGKLLAARGDRAAAREALEDALDAAERQQAPLFVLRAATDLAELDGFERLPLPVRARMQETIVSASRAAALPELDRLRRILSSDSA